MTFTSRYFVVLLSFFVILEVSRTVGSNDLSGDAFFEILDPTELEYTYRIIPARDFGAPFNRSFQLKSAKLVPMDPIDGCSYPKNYHTIFDNVAFAMRGECSFLHKTLVAEKCGAKAIIISELESDSIWDTTFDDYIEMIADKSGVDAKIPAAFLIGRSGFYIYNTLSRLHLPYAIINIPVNMTYVSVSKMNQPPWVSW